MSLDLGLSPEREHLGLASAAPAAPQAPALSQDDTALRSARQMVTASFARLYGERGAQAEHAFAAAVHRDGLAPALHALGTQPAAFGTVVGDGAASAQRLAGGLGAAIDMGAYAERAHAAAGETPSALASAIAARGVVTWADEQAARASEGHAPLGAASTEAREAGLSQRPPEVLDRILDYLYEINESRVGSWVAGAASLDPRLDRLLDAVDLALNIRSVNQPEHRTDPHAWANLVTTVIGTEVPEIGDLIEAELNDVIRGGPAAAVRIMETLGPALRRAGLDPAPWLEAQARILPGVVSEAVKDATQAVVDGLHYVGERDRYGVPDWIEAGANEAAASMSRVGRDVQRGLRLGVEPVAQAMRDLAAAARGERPAPTEPPRSEQAVAREREPEPGAVRGIADNNLPRIALERDGWHTLHAGEARNFIEAEAITIYRKLYRIIENPRDAEGGYWSYELPSSMAEWRSD